MAGADDSVIAAVVAAGERGMTRAEVAATCNRHHSTVIPTLTRLAARGLVCRVELAHNLTVWVAPGVTASRPGETGPKGGGKPDPKNDDAVLRALRESPWLSGQEVARRAGLGAHATASALKRLEAAGHVARDRCVGAVSRLNRWRLATTPPTPIHLARDITLSDDVMLDAVREHPHTMAGELATLIGHRAHNVKLALRRLEREGLVARDYRGGKHKAALWRLATDPPAPVRATGEDDDEELHAYMPTPAEIAARAAEELAKRSEIGQLRRFVGGRREEWAVPCVSGRTARRQREPTDAELVHDFLVKYVYGWIEPKKRRRA